MGSQRRQFIIIMMEMSQGTSQCRSLPSVELHTLTTVEHSAAARRRLAMSFDTDEVVSRVVALYERIISVSHALLS